MNTFRTHENGGLCCTASDPAQRCAKCQAHAGLRTIQEDDMEDYTTPDPYAADLANLRAASDTSTPFEKQYKAESIEALASEHADNVAHCDDAYRFETLSADDLAAYRPPNGYVNALKEQIR